MPIHFQADADLNANILRAMARREPAVDFRSALAAGLPGRPDPEVLAIAADERRILVTHDHRTMPSEFADFVAAHRCFGIIVVPQHLPLEVVVDELILVWAATEPEEWHDRLAWLPL